MPGALSVEELESRMRPLQWSHEGFLGPEERLMTVIDRDAETLAELQVTYELLSDRLEALLLAQMERDMGGSSAILDAELTHEVEIWISMGTQTCPWATVPEQVEGRPEERYPWIYPGMSALVCDAGFPLIGGNRAGSFDWQIRNLASGLQMHGPGLAGHLIREHHFFEGLESGYRIDPRTLAEVLGLGPFSTWTVG